MKKIFLSFIFIIFLVFPVFSQTENKFSILHICDTNGNIDSVFTKSPDGKVVESGGLARVSYFVKDFRENNPDTFFVSSGDIIAPMPGSSRTKGKLTIKLLNMAKLDVWSPGNYDFLYGFNEINQRISEAEFNVISTNLYLKSTGKPWLKPYVILEKNGKKIAFLGATPFLYFNNVPEDVIENIEVKSVFDSVKETASQIKGQVDFIVLIAQMNNDAKTEILNNTDVDLIVGGIELYKESEIMNFRTRNHKVSAVTPGYTTTVGQVNIDLSEKPSIKRVTEHFLDFERYSLDKISEKVKDVIDVIYDYRKSIKDQVIGNFTKSPSIEESHRFVANVLRNSTNSDLTVLRNAFFLRRAKLYPEITKERVFTMVHLPVKGVKIRINGSDLKAFFNSINRNEYVFSGIEGNLINGVSINNSEKYFLVTDEILARNNLILKERGTPFLTDENINQIILSFFEKNKDKPIDFNQLDNYDSWKAGFNLDIDPQFLKVELPKEGKYNYLAWRSDQTATRWGGLFTGFFRRYWSQNQFENILEAEFRQQQTGTAPISVYADRLRFTSTFNRLWIPDLLTPFAEVKVSTLFTNPDPKKNYLLFGQVVTGFTHSFPFGIKIREGVELRKNFLDDKLPWMIGGALGLQFNNSFYFVRESLDAKIFIPFNYNTFVTDIENRLSFQAGFFNIFYKINLYNESSDLKNWALRHNIGIGLSLDNSFSF